MKHILDTKDFSSFERTFLRLSTEAKFLLIESGIYGNEGEEGTIHHHYVNSKQIDESIKRLY